MFEGQTKKSWLIIVLKISVIALSLQSLLKKPTHAHSTVEEVAVLGQVTLLPRQHLIVMEQTPAPGGLIRFWCFEFFPWHLDLGH